MLNTLGSTVPQGTHIVVLQPGSNDPAMTNPTTKVDVEKMVATLRERHIEVLLIPGANLRGRELRELADKYDALVAPHFGKSPRSRDRQTASISARRAIE
jgi:hypothetical protein